MRCGGQFKNKFHSGRPLWYLNSVGNSSNYHIENLFSLWFLQQIYTTCPHTHGADTGSDGDGGDSGDCSSDFRAFECFISRSVNFISNIDIMEIGMDSRLSGKWFRDREREGGRMRLGNATTKIIKYYGQFIRHNGFRLHFYVFICCVFWFIDFYSGTECELERLSIHILTTILRCNNYFDAWK